MTRQEAATTAGPARIWRPAGFRGALGFITPMSDHHCPSCNRLRLTAAGRLRPCLFGVSDYDLRTPLRQGADDAMLAGLFLDAMQQKTALTCQDRPAEAPASLPMVSIGG
jgi:cyclic pyranopterin phosphate synthase